MFWPQLDPSIFQGLLLSIETETSPVCFPPFLKFKRCSCKLPNLWHFVITLPVSLRLLCWLCWMWAQASGASFASSATFLFGPQHSTCVQAIHRESTSTQTHSLIPRNPMGMASWIYKSPITPKSYSMDRQLAVGPHLSTRKEGYGIRCYCKFSVASTLCVSKHS